MATVSVRMTTSGLAETNKRLAKLLNNAEHMEKAWQEAADYMVRSTKNRINRTKTGPEGDKWAALSAVTTQLKGHDWPLYATGALVSGITVGQVSNDGFQVISNAPYSSYMQAGVKKLRGKFRSKRPAPQVPPRPFMGFSKENNRRISKIIWQHLMEQT
jgi:phage gpG-like protein